VTIARDIAMYESVSYDQAVLAVVSVGPLDPQVKWRRAALAMIQTHDHAAPLGKSSGLLRPARLEHGAPPESTKQDVKDRAHRRRRKQTRK
jgi:hypothetical protein